MLTLLADRGKKKEADALAGFVDAGYRVLFLRLGKIPSRAPAPSGTGPDSSLFRLLIGVFEPVSWIHEWCLALS